MIFIADFIACSTCFGHHYAHHQELESIIQMVAACCIWCFGFQQQQPANRTHNPQLHTIPTTWKPKHQIPLPVVFGALVFKLSVWCWAEGYVSGLQAACWASNKICNKYHLLHLVGILFPHINDDPRSESLQIYISFSSPSQEPATCRCPDPYHSSPRPPINSF